MHFLLSARERMFNFAMERLRPFFPKGSSAWLIAAELKYGGFVTNIPRNKVSPHDLRNPDELKTGGMIGGDRMSPFHHGYARRYAAYLKPFVASGAPVVCVEIGVLQGTGVAIWSDLFANGVIFGLDIDLAHARNNLDRLKQHGAFATGNFELHEFDQYACDADRVGRFLKGRRIDIAIDDGAHTDKAILNAFTALRPHLSPSAVYFVEDNDAVHERLRELVDDWKVRSFGQLTVLTGPEFPEAASD